MSLIKTFTPFYSKVLRQDFLKHDSPYWIPSPTPIPTNPSNQTPTSIPLLFKVGGDSTDLWLILAIAKKPHSSASPLRMAILYVTWITSTVQFTCRKKPKCNRHDILASKFQYHRYQEMEKDLLVELYALLNRIYYCQYKK